MKTIFIPTKYTGKVDVSKIKVDRLPKKIGIVTTAQFIDKIIQIKNYLIKNNKTVFIGKDKQKEGQVLGCDVGAAEKIKKALPEVSRALKLIAKKRTAHRKRLDIV